MFKFRLKVSIVFNFLDSYRNGMAVLLREDQSVWMDQVHSVLTLPVALQSVTTSNVVAYQHFNAVCRRYLINTHVNLFCHLIAIRLGGSFSMSEKTFNLSFSVILSGSGIPCPQTRIRISESVQPEFPDPAVPFRISFPQSASGRSPPCLPATFRRVCC